MIRLGDYPIFKNLVFFWKERSMKKNLLPNKNGISSSQRAIRIENHKNQINLFMDMVESSIKGAHACQQFAYLKESIQVAFKELA